MMSTDWWRLGDTRPEKQSVRMCCVCVCESWTGCCLYPETGLDSGRPGPSQEPEAKVHGDREVLGYLFECAVRKHSIE